MMGVSDGGRGGANDHTSLSRGVRSHNLTGFFHQQNRALVELPWQVIQVKSMTERYSTRYNVIVGC